MNKSWKIVTKDNFQNQQYVFPAAQESVLRIVRNAKNIPAVERVTVFGSCVESRFSPHSDIDIYVEQDVDERFLLAKGVMRGVDYWTQYYCDQDILKEIKRNGVVVYER